MRSSRKDFTPLDQIPKVPVHKHFRHNVGKTGQIFDQKRHPYFKYIKEYPDKNAIEKAKLNFPLYRIAYTSKTGAKVYASEFAKDAQDYGINLQFAKIYADNGYDIRLLPYVNY